MWLRLQIGLVCIKPQKKVSTKMVLCKSCLEFEFMCIETTFRAYGLCWKGGPAQSLRKSNPLGNFCSAVKFII